MAFTTTNQPALSTPVRSSAGGILDLKMIFNYIYGMTSIASPLVEEWLQRLQASGYRVTGPRRILVELMATSPRALGPIELYDLGRAQYPNLGLVTVYRTLEKLEELGLIQRVHQEDGCHRYLRATQGHQHLLVCTRCGRVAYFDGDDLSRLIARTEAETGYHIEDHWLQLYGCCPQCRNQST